MPARSKSIIIFDGSNFYHKLRELRIPHKSGFDYSSFSKFLTRKSLVTSRYFCIGKIQAKQRNKKAREMMAKQQSLVTRLQKQGFTIQFGYLLKTKGAYHEKGVDIQIATNLLMDAFRNKFTTAYLVSSDSDLIPAISASQSLSKRIVYVGFKHKPSRALVRATKKQILLTRDDLLPFIGK